MSPSDQPQTPGFARPSARGTAMPIQRGNYGVPPRQTPVQPVQPPVVPQPAQSAPPTPVAPTPAGPRVMDIAAPTRPVQAPQTVASQPATVQPPQPATPEPPRPLSAPATTQPGVPSNPLAQPVKPLFTATPTPTQAAKTQRAASKRRILSHWRTIVLVGAALLCIGGMGRFVTAGSTSGHEIAVGAVKANDGRDMTIQFVADDGLMHKFTEASNAEMIPGTAVQVAYRSGAPEASVKRVAVVQGNRALGTQLFLSGVVLLIIIGSVVLIQKQRGKRGPIPLTTPVTA